MLVGCGFHILVTYVYCIHVYRVLSNQARITGLTSGKKDTYNEKQMSIRRKGIRMTDGVME